MYEIKFLKKAHKELKKIDQIWQRQIIKKIKKYAENPKIFKNNVKKLAGKYEDYYRLRVGNYRVIFNQKDTTLIILIIRIAHRKEVY